MLLEDGMRGEQGPWGTEAGGPLPREPKEGLATGAAAAFSIWLNLASAGPCSPCESRGFSKVTLLGLAAKLWPSG